MTNLVYIIRKTPKNIYWYTVSDHLKLKPACPPHVGLSSQGGIPSLRIARHVPPMPGGSFNSLQPLIRCPILVALPGECYNAVDPGPSSSKGQSKALLTPRLGVRFPPGAPDDDKKELCRNGKALSISRLPFKKGCFPRRRHRDRFRSRFPHAVGEPTAAVPALHRFPASGQP